MEFNNKCFLPEPEKERRVEKGEKIDRGYVMKMSRIYNIDGSDSHASIFMEKDSRKFHYFLAYQDGIPIRVSLTERLPVNLELYSDFNIKGVEIPDPVDLVEHALKMLSNGIADTKPTAIEQSDTKPTLGGRIKRFLLTQGE